MALELSMIIGNEPVTATVILYGFLQQHLMFEAFAGFGSTTGIEFLKEIATVFSMIGMLVLFFSPSLWKAKYIVSWVALFLIVTLGGSMGFEFGYNFADSPDRAILRQPMHATNSFCTKAELKANNGVCTRQSPANKAREDALVLAQGKGTETVSEITLSSYDTSSFRVVGFYPQVLAMYVTNKLAFNLEMALSNLEQRTYREKQLMLESLQNSEVPESQLKVDIAVFDKLCSGAVKNASGLTTEYALALNNSDTILLNDKLSATPFTLADAAKAIEISNAVNKVDVTTSPVLIDILPAGAPTAQVDKFHSSMTTGVSNDKYFLQNFTVNQGFGDDPALHKSYDNSTLKEITDQQALAIEARDMADSKIYKKTINKLLSDDNSALSADDTVALIMPNTSVVKSKKMIPQPTSGNAASLQAHQQKLNSLNHAAVKEDIKAINNCGELLMKINNKHNEMIGKNIEDFDQQAKIYAQNQCGRAGTSQNIREICSRNLSNSYLKSNINPALKADESFSNYIEAITRSCDSSEDIDRCNKEIDGAKFLKRKAEIVNAKRSISQAVSAEHDITSAVNDGVTGIAQDLGQAWTEAWAAPLAGLKSISASFDAGAYKAVLPLIRDILIAFILVLTPVFFLLGLLVPAWAPGVIITCVFSILFLQMIDVTMILIDSLLGIVARVLEPVSKVAGGGYTEATFDGILETIWAMAYMASFAITAFLMFAVGNSKAILTKMAGMDSTIQSTSQQIAQTGWQVTKAGASIAAGAATGGAMGGSLGAKTANAIAGGQEFAKIADERGFKEAFNSVGGTTAGNYAKRREAFRDSGIATMSSEAEALGKQKRKVEDKNMIWDEKVSQGADKSPIETDNIQKKATDRADKKTRLRHKEFPLEANMGGVVKDSIDRAEKDQGVAGNEFKGRSFHHVDKDGKSMSGKELSVTEQFSKSLNSEVKEALGFVPVNKLPDSKPSNMSQAEWNSQIAANKKQSEINTKAIKDATTLSSAIAQGTYKNMSAKNITESNGKLTQGFESKAKIQSDIQSSLAQVYKGKNMDAQAIANAVAKDMANVNKVMDKFGSTGHNGEFNIKYKPELKSKKAKPGRPY